MRHICKIEKPEIRAAIKYFLPPKEIHADFMQTLGKESPSYSTVKKKWAAEFKRERALRMIYGQAAPKMPPVM